MKRFEVKNISNSVKNQAYRLWIDQLKQAKMLCKEITCDIYYIQSLKDFGDFNNIYDFVLTLMCKLQVNEIKPDDIEFYNISKDFQMPIIFNKEAYSFYKEHYQHDYIQKIYRQKMGLENNSLHK